MNPTPIDCLPPEMICKILKNLNLDDLINCKLVCKRWYSIIFDLIKITKLVVIDEYNFDKFWRRWYHSNELINQDLEYCKINSFLTHFKQNILSNLKQLRIDRGFPTSFDWNQLNLFTKLIHLEIDFTVYYLNLNLPDLEVLKFHYLGSLSHLSIECPKLRVLCFYDNDDVDLNIKYPETVKDLQSSFTGEKLARFKNVEYLKYYDSELLGILNETTLRNLRNLKEITCTGSISYLIGYDIFNRTPVRERISEMKSILRDFLRSAEELKMSDLKLNVAGLQLTEHNIDLIDFGVTEDERLNDTHFYAVNYKYVQDSSPFIYEVDYTQLLKSFDQIPKDYFIKFLNIQMVSASGSIDQVHFLWFLKNLDCLKKLDLKDTNLSQFFFDELPTVCKLTDFSLTVDLELNFDFVAKFIKLKFLNIYSNLSLKSAKSLIRSFRNLKYSSGFRLSFQFKKKFYRIQRNRKDSNRYDVQLLICQYRILKENLNLDEVVRYFEELE